MGGIKIMLRWLCYLILNWIIVLFCWWTNPIACLFPSMQANGRDKLWGIFNLWSTHDNYVDEFYFGKYDKDMVDEKTYYSHSCKGRVWRYWYRLRWLKRNTAYGFSYKFLSMPKGSVFQWKGISKPFWLFGMKVNDYNIGWKAHKGFDRLNFAGRIIGLRKAKDE